MLSVRDTASELGISEQRVRAMLSSGQLQGQKIGRTWAVEAGSVARRKSLGAAPGRPRSGVPRVEMPSVEEAHLLYDSCRRVLSGCFSAEFLGQARDAQEERFWVEVATFFLEERQRELVTDGVY